ncbi:MAG: glycosyltransferase [Flavobacteriales bacterium]|nr:glycosyltransferase [Bacteroidota bacterium]MCB9241701.1 glycosyltransferase [Flavobacteriales bacterium]
MRPPDKHLHVVAFDVPYPANYGGVIDIYYRLAALSEAGVRIHLHCYQYGRSESAMLKGMCESVTYYRRKIFKNPIYNTKPYIVASRNSTQLIENLMRDEHPILFEGLHCTYYLADPRLKDRYKIVRTHNVEHHYYKHLERVENNLFKKYFFKVESDRLKRYERVLKHANLIAAISPNDQYHFDRKYGNTIWIPPFHVNNQVTTKEGQGKFILYHGNLSVGENNEAAMYLINHVLKDLQLPVVIAGNDPSDELKQLVEQYSFIKLKHQITSEEINHLIADAQINLLHTNQATGIKLKLINALFMGRHCVANSKMTRDTGLESLCRIADTPAAYKKAILDLWETPMDHSELEKRETTLLEQYDNERSAAVLLKAIGFEHHVQSKFSHLFA